MMNFSMMYGTAWKEDRTTALTKQAVEAGFVAIDTANQPKHYQEPLVGEALLQLADQGITRDQLFLQTKFTPLGGQDHRIPYDKTAPYSEQVEQSFASSLQQLHTDYLDSYLLHGPYVRRGLSDADWEVWGALEKLYSDGKCKQIGISNVTVEQVYLLIENANIKPMAVQNRCYASQGWDADVRELCRKHNIQYQGFSLLTANRNVWHHPELQQLADRVNATPAQVLYRFSQMMGMLPLSGTTNLQHVQEALASESVVLTEADVALIKGL